MNFAGSVRHTAVIAQLVRAQDCGSWGRGFESRWPPHFYKKIGGDVLRIHLGLHVKWVELCGSSRSLNPTISDASRRIPHERFEKMLKPRLAQPQLRGTGTSELSELGYSRASASILAPRYPLLASVPALPEQIYWPNPRHLANLHEF
jgi:hypothetical protein